MNNIDKIQYSKEDIAILGRLVSIANDGVVASAWQIWDDLLKEWQGELNKRFNSSIQYLDINTSTLGVELQALKDEIAKIKTGGIVDIIVNGEHMRDGSDLVVDLGTVIREHQSLDNYYTKDQLYTKADLYTKDRLYTKDDLYTKEEVDYFIQVIPKLDKIVLDQLPSDWSEYADNLVLVPAETTEDNDYYDEYIVIVTEVEMPDGFKRLTYAPEKIGTTRVDLSRYATKEDLFSSESQLLDEMQEVWNTWLTSKNTPRSWVCLDNNGKVPASLLPNLNDEYTLVKSGTSIELKKNGSTVSIVDDYDDTQVRSDIQQLNTDINTQTGRINTALSDLETAKTTKIAEMDAAKVAAETATAAAIVATQNADAATQATQTAIAQAERLNVELEGSVITVTDKDGNESEIDLLDATNERVYINVTTNKEGQSVEGLVINCFLNNDVDEPLQATTNANGQCYFDIPNNYHYKLVFPTIVGCDPITDVTHIAHASQRIVDVEYKETQDPYIKTGEYLIVSLKKKYNGVSQPLEGQIVTITKSGESPVQYTTDSNGDVRADIPYGTEYTVILPNVEDYYVVRNKYDYTFYASQSNRAVAVHYYHYDSGLFIVTSDGTPYNYDQWVTAEQEQRVTKEDAKLIMFATDILIGNNGVFAVDIDTYRNTNFNTNNYKKQWANNINYIFTDIPTNGSVVSADYYYDGYTASVKMEAEAANVQSLSTAAASFCLSQSREVGGVMLPGFLGSPGQWEIFWNHKAEAESLIDVVRPRQEGQTVYSIGTYEKWTSAQVNHQRACYFTNVKGNATNIYNAKDTSYVTIPFFAM